LPDFNNVGSGWNPAIEVGKSSNLELEGPTISGSTDEHFINVWENSLLEITNSNIAIGNASVGIGISGNSRLMLRDSTVTGTVENKLIANWDASSSDIQNSEIIVSSNDIGIGTYGNSRLFLGSSKLTGTISNNLMNINDGSSAQISESELVAQSGEKGIDVLGNSMLKFENSSLETVHHGLIVYRSSYAEVRKGASIKSISGNAAQISLGSGLEIPEDASIVSTENVALNLHLSSWTRINDGGNITIDGADSESDVYVSESSTLRVDNGNLIEKIHCWNNGTVYASEGTVTSLAPSCTE